MKKYLNKFLVRLTIFRGLFRYLWRNKLWWMIPMVLILFVFGAIFILGQSTPLGPFIYTIF